MLPTSAHARARPRQPPPLPAAAAASVLAAACQPASLRGHTVGLTAYALMCLPCVLQVVIQKGKLNVKVLEMFEQTEHESLLASTAGLDKWSLPLLTCDQNGPLGYTKPTWQ
jgi:hypothetical protein